MSDIAPATVPQAKPEPLTPIPADPPQFSVSVTPVIGPAPVPAAPAPVSSPVGVAGLDQYAGDFAAAVSSFIPAPLRAVFYPLGYLVSIGVVVLGTQHVISLDASLLIAGAIQAFSTGLSTSNVPKVK
jgi:hypothetical protein